VDDALGIVGDGKRPRRWLGFSFREWLTGFGSRGDYVLIVRSGCSM
jgi:hypothetical protein